MNVEMICQGFNSRFDECYEFDEWTGNGKSVKVTYKDDTEVIVKPKDRIRAEVWVNGKYLGGDDIFVVGYRDVLSILLPKGEVADENRKIKYPWEDVVSIELMV